MTEITINPMALLVALYAGFKVIAAVWISYREIQNPIWNSEGVPVSREFHHVLGLLTRNCIINPEWGILKMIAFVPVFLATGRRHLRSFVPWRVPKAPPSCQVCGDKGKYFVKPFITGYGDVRTGKVQGKRKGIWQICECQLKQHIIGGLSNAQGTIFETSEMQCDRQNQRINEERAQRMSAVWQPFRYLDVDDPFCGEKGHVLFSEGNQCFLPAKDHTRLRIGETVTIGSVQRLHRSAHLLGRPLKIMALNLPFAVVEYEYGGISGRGTVNFRGTTLHGDSETGFSPYQPRLKPTSLKVGDKFALMQLGISSLPTDGSYRGQAFRVVKSAHRLTADTGNRQAGMLVLACQHLSFYSFANPTYLECEDLQIIAANDRYIRATER